MLKTPISGEDEDETPTSYQNLPLLAVSFLGPFWLHFSWPLPGPVDLQTGIDHYIALSDRPFLKSNIVDISASL